MYNFTFYYLFFIFYYYYFLLLFTATAQTDIKAVTVLFKTRNKYLAMLAIAKYLFIIY